MKDRPRVPVVRALDARTSVELLKTAHGSPEYRTIVAVVYLDSLRHRWRDMRRG